MIAELTTVIAITALVAVLIEHGVLLKAEDRIRALEVKMMREEASRNARRR
jgi:hypothetical protein